MAIVHDCPACGRKLTAPDELAGKKARCPFCQAVVAVPEAPVFEAEAVPPRTPQMPEMELPPPLERAAIRREPPEPADEEPTRGDRKPCPICGEMILRSAVKCRFCGEILDRRIRPRSAENQLDKTYNSQMVGLGALWIIFGGLSLITLAAVASNPRAEMVAGLLLMVGVVGSLWMLFGIGTCCKQIWAVYGGLVFSYIAVAGGLIQILLGLNAPGPGGVGPLLCGHLFALCIFILGIVQGHRVIGMSGQLSRQRRND